MEQNNTTSASDQTDIQDKSSKDELLLWNPNAAANWSLLFTPIFGAYLHAKNWQQLNEPENAKKSMLWVYAGIILYLAVIFIGEKASSIGILFLIIWYFTMARKQVKYIKEKNIAYTKKSWKKPLMYAVGGWVAYVCLVAVLTNFIDFEISRYESEAIPMVSKILKNQGGVSAPMCTSVSIIKTVSKTYVAQAHLSNGRDAKIVITVNNGKIQVNLLDY